MVGRTNGRVAGVDIQRGALKCIVCTVSGRKTTTSYTVRPVQGFQEERNLLDSLNPK